MDRVIRLFCMLALLGVAGAGLFGCVSDTVKPKAALQPYSMTELQQAAQQFARALDAHHFLPPGEVQKAAEIQDYLAVLDPQKEWLLAEDVTLLAKQALAWRQGDLTAVFQIYEGYRQRKRARLHWILDRLQHPTALLDFTEPRTFLPRDSDRARWFVSPQAADRYWSDYLQYRFLLGYQRGYDDQDNLAGLKNRYRASLEQLEETRAREVAETFLNAMGQRYDPHTHFYLPRRGWKPDLSLQGLGLVLGKDLDETRVVKSISGGPAAGLIKPNDIILAVAQGAGDFVEVQGWPLDRVTELLRGPQGSPVRVRLQRGVDGASLEVGLKRDRVRLNEQRTSLRFHPPEGGGRGRIAVIRIPSFYIDFTAMQRGDRHYSSVSRDVASQLQELKRQQVDTLLLDLRDNGGGAMREAGALLALFVGPGPTVQLRLRNGERRVLNNPDSAIGFQGRLGVLVNAKTAGAAEVVAAGIQDYGRGILMGGRTFGMGSLASMHPLNPGAARITMAKYYRVSGANLHLDGVLPDLVFSPQDNPAVGQGQLPYNLAADEGLPPLEHLRYNDLSATVRMLNEAMAIDRGPNVGGAGDRRGWPGSGRRNPVQPVPLNRNAFEPRRESLASAGRDATDPLLDASLHALQAWQALPMAESAGLGR